MLAGLFFYPKTVYTRIIPRFAEKSGRQSQLPAVLYVSLLLFVRFQVRLKDKSDSILPESSS